MSHFHIVTDSAADLPVGFFEGDPQVSVVPLTIHLGERVFVDDETLDTNVLLTELNSTGQSFSTACPSPESFLSAFEQADFCFAVVISSQLSGSYQCALAARQMALERYPDKKSMSSILSWFLADRRCWYGSCASCVPIRQPISMTLYGRLSYTDDHYGCSLL